MAPEELITKVLAMVKMVPGYDMETFISGWFLGAPFSEVSFASFTTVLHARSLPCLEPRRDPAFQSPVREEAFVCRRCIRLAGRALDGDPDHDWTKPSSGAVADRGQDD